ncbi:uncharacterized protein K489DRAFT_185807 [Dissoconium aciculare CBS 342.82]|uniref:Uncharacterized protein n=1 Tax=Dissoconium aciculare CBS 342.82 TaxID=1314786 RepID=A0A6J3M9T9_9PEZI|nr:uncharacterized protein K489DRAFT_185807 [Dissoconium aciculare CBS 342.82]KAF1824603.1 hypothetical protein K489DRAFT_185807 [Dissoconium aciculare CBS 342.82]
MPRREGQTSTRKPRSRFLSHAILTWRLFPRACVCVERERERAREKRLPVRITRRRRIRRSSRVAMGLTTPHRLEPHALISSTLSFFYFLLEGRKCCLLLPRIAAPVVWG